MRGEEHRGRDYSYDRGREVPQYITEKHGTSNGRNFVENDTGSERNYRKSVGDASVSFDAINPNTQFLRFTTLQSVQYQFGVFRVTTFFLLV